MADQYQTITLTLADGSKHLFSGPACIVDSGPDLVLPIQVSPPRDLPPGCSFERIDAPETHWPSCAHSKAGAATP